MFSKLCFHLLLARVWFPPGVKPKTLLGGPAGYPSGSLDHRNQEHVNIQKLSTEEKGSRGGWEEEDLEQEGDANKVEEESVFQGKEVAGCVERHGKGNAMRRDP